MNISESANTDQSNAVTKETIASPKRKRELHKRASPAKRRRSMATHQHAILQTLKEMHKDMKVESQKQFKAHKAMHEKKTGIVWTVFGCIETKQTA